MSNKTTKELRANALAALGLLTVMLAGAAVVAAATTPFAWGAVASWIFMKVI
jgi:hypothetical protein